MRRDPLMSWWTDEDSHAYNREAIERDRMASRTYRIVEVPRRAGRMEELEVQLHLLTEAIRARTTT